MAESDARHQSPGWHPSLRCKANPQRVRRAACSSPRNAPSEHGLNAGSMVASALEADCETLYTEDLQDGQLIEERLTIRNPFRPHNRKA